MKRLICLLLSMLMTSHLLTACDFFGKNDSPVPEQYLPEISEGENEMIDADIIKSTIASSDDGNGNYSNPVIFADVPDVDFIRVDDAYYMVSTTMHLSPGCPIMKSYDLVNWEIVNYVYNTLGDADNLALRNSEHNYGQGQWAASIRYNDGIYYVGFLSYATGKSYIYHTDDIENGKWDRFEFNEGFHDMSLLFDDDGRVYIIYGGGQIWCVELEKDLSAIKPETKRRIIDDADLFQAVLPRVLMHIKLTVIIIFSSSHGRRMTEELSFAIEASLWTANGR